MPSTYSPLLRLELMADGENPNTWGAKANTNLSLLERAISKRQAIVLAAANYTLTTANGAEDEARSLALDLSGTLSANVAVIIPNVSKSYIVKNSTTGNFTVTFKTAAGATVVVAPQGRITMIWCDGVGDGAVYSLFESLVTPTGRNAWLAGDSNAFEVVADAGTGIIDTALGNVFEWTLGGNRTAQLDNAVDGSWVELYLKQDGTGGRTVTWPGNVLWQNGSAPGLTPIPAAIDKISLRYNGATSTWWGTYDLNISSGALPGSIPDITISGGHVNIDAYSLAGRPAGPVSFTFRVSAGSNIGSLSTATPAGDFNGFATGSTISIVNEGVIHGRGGRGGRGAFAGDVSSADLFGDATAGGAGGDAIRGPSNATTSTITNINGRILGGGGGGGGAGGGESGDGGSIVSANGSPGLPGSVGRNGTFGTGGTGADTGGTGTAGLGGDGGAYGAAGSNGQSQTANTLDGAPGTGGAAGRAFNVNGGTAPTFINGNTSPNVEGAVA